MSYQPQWDNSSNVQTSPAWPQPERPTVGNEYPAPSEGEKFWPVELHGPAPGGGNGHPYQGPATFRVRLVKVTSALLITHRQAGVVTGTREQIETAYRAALLHNLLLGWWGIPFGLIWTPVALAANAKALRQVRAASTK